MNGGKHCPVNRCTVQSVLEDVGKRYKELQNRPSMRKRLEDAGLPSSQILALIEVLAERGVL